MCVGKNNYVCECLFNTFGLFMLDLSMSPCLISVTLFKYTVTSWRDGFDVNKSEVKRHISQKGREQAQCTGLCMSHEYNVE